MFFSHGFADKQSTFDAHDAASAHSPSLVAKKEFIVRENMVFLAPAAERSPVPSTPRDFRRMGSLASTPLSKHDFELALKTSPRKTRRLSLPHRSSKVNTPVWRLKREEKKRRLDCVVVGEDEKETHLVLKFHCSSSASRLGVKSSSMEDLQI